MEGVRLTERDTASHTEERVAALHSYALITGDRDPSLDLVCRVAALACGASYALIGLLADDRTWALTASDWASDALSEGLWLCDAVVRAQRPVAVPSAGFEGEASRDTLGLTGPRSGAGVPLNVRGGVTVGALCVIDNRTRSYSAGELTYLKDLSGLTSALFEFRRTRALIPLHVPLDEVESVVADVIEDGLGGASLLATLRRLNSRMEAMPRQLLATRRDPAADSDATRILALTEDSGLSVRQSEIVSRLVKGDRVPAIAQALHVSQSTVRNHLSSAFNKLGVRSQQGIIDLVRDRDRLPVEHLCKAT